MLRHQLPVYSPLSPGAVASGVRAALLGSADSRTEVERALRQYLGASRILLTDSGTTALRLALEAVGRVEDGGPVALPAFSCFDVATAAVGAGLPVVFYDLEPETLSPAPESLRRALGAGARALVVAHLYGIPVDMATVKELAGEFDVPIIEDAAQGFGARYDGRPLGTLGSVGILSFGRGKGVSGGSGGCLFTSAADRESKIMKAVEARDLERARGWSVVTKAAAQWFLGRPSLYGIPAALPWLRLGETHYRPPREPAGLSHAAAGILTRTMSPSLKEVEVRRRNAESLCQALEGARGVTVIRSPVEGRSSRLRLPVLVDDAGRDAFSSRASARLGIMPGYPRSLPELPALTPLRHQEEKTYPGSARLAKAVFTLPTHSLLGESDLAKFSSLAQ